MKKQILLTILASIIILIAVILIREIILTSVPNIDKTDVINRETAISLIENGKNYNNYSVHIKTKLGQEDFYYKNKILTHYINEKLDYWINLNENNESMINIDNKTNIAKISSTFSNPFTNIKELEFYDIIPDTQNYNFEALGAAPFNNRKTYIIKLKNKNNSNIFIKKQNIYFIDAETGVMIKIINKTKFCNLTCLQKIYDRHIQFNNVPDELIEKPDLTKITNIYTEDMPYIPIN